MSAKNQSESSNVKKWGPVTLLPGVSAGNMTVYALGAVVAMLFCTFIPQMQPYLFTEILHIPQGEQGMLSGYLGVAATLVGLIMPGIWGTASDKLGRRIIYAAGFLLATLGVFLYPLAGVVTFLFVFRMLFSAGVNGTNTMRDALLGDYVDNKDRGKAYGMISVAGGIGALLTVFLFLRLPSMLQNSGMDSAAAGRTTYWIVAAIGLAAMLTVYFGLLGRSNKQAEDKRTVKQIVAEALDAAKKDRRLSLAYGANFAASGAVTAIGTFFTLWIVTYGTTQGNLDSAAALAKAGMIMGISQMMGLIASPIFGILCDKVDRVKMVIIATGATAVIYLCTLLIANPLNNIIIVLGLFIGLFQISGVITGGALVAQQAPEAVRGSVMGFYGFCGALGIMLLSLLGGWLFDHWLYQGPFVLVAILCAIVAIWGVTVLAKKA